MTSPVLASLDVRPLSGAIGAEVVGVDLANLSDEQWAAIHDAWLEHLVLFFPDQHLTPDEHVAMGRRLGEIDIHPFISKLDDEHPEVAVIAGTRGYADNWHTDVTFSETPPLASILRMDTLPARGGDTLFSNQYLAYETLSAPMRQLLDGLTTVHTAYEYRHPEQSARHPAVCVHPETGRKMLYVNRVFTSHFPELSRRESDMLLNELVDWSEQASFQCRYRWTEGAVAMWDNRCTQHYGANDYDDLRVVHRVTVVGERPIGPDRPDWPVFDDVNTKVSNHRRIAPVGPVRS
ncbi:MAG: taurine dioxygenase [Actinomycetia bacterium]|nr:taurine dioxygenase [Actinomycetes bacterium]